MNFLSTFSWIRGSEIQFPGLGLEINPPVGFNAGPFSVHFYGVIIALGLLLAVLYGLKRSKQFGLKEDDILDGVLWIVPVAIIFARAYYCIFEWDQFKDDPISVLYIWKGGIAIYGGVIGATLGVILHCKIKKISLRAVLDLVAISFLIGQCIGRWGNFFNREAFGSETDFFLRMGLFNTVIEETEYHHPTFLYESLWNLIGFVLLHFLSKKRRYDGQIALGYCAWYGFGRAIIEGLRTDSLYLGGLRVSQLLAAVSCFAAVVILMLLSFRRHEESRLFVNQVAAREAEEAELRALLEEDGEEEEEDEPSEAAEEIEKAEEAEEVNEAQKDEE